MSTIIEKDDLIEHLKLKVLLLEKEIKYLKGSVSKVFINAETQCDSSTLLDEYNLYKEENDRGNLSIADMIRETSESCLSMSGYTYDEKTGLYYNSQYGYYYDPTNMLFYNPKTGIYYSYDSDTHEYKYHSKDNIEELSKMSSELLWMQGYQHRPQVMDKRSKMTDDDKYNQAPCIRIIDESIAELQIVTCSGGSIGTDPSKDHTILLVEPSCSEELDFRITYDKDRNQYEIHESTEYNNATLNSVTVTKIPQPMSHHSRLVIGDRTFLIHIHEDYSTCDWCEPGQVKAKLLCSPVKDVDQKPNKWGRMRIVNQLKVKYGLKGTVNPRPGFWRTPKRNGENSNYIDRALIRRTSEKQEKKFEKPSEGKVAIRIMEKMGWVSGDALGATGSGITEPIAVQQRPDARAGIGCPQQYSLETDIDPSVKRRRRFMNSTRIRYQSLFSE